MTLLRLSSKSDIITESKFTLPKVYLLFNFSNWFSLSTRLKYIITSVNGSDDTKDIRNFVDNFLLARDSRALREHIRETQPDVDLNVVLGSGEEVKVPIGLNFFWPDA